MEIKKLFERDTVKTEETLKRNKVSGYSQDQNASSGHAVAGEDRVSISPLYRQLTQVAKIVQDDEEDRKKKVAEIKQRVESGNYEVDSTAVAGALVSFAADTDDIARS